MKRFMIICGQSKFFLAVLLAAAITVFGSAASGTPIETSETFGFGHILEPGDGPAEIANGAAGEAQLFVDVVDEGPGQVLFRFRNVGPTYCRISDVYFDNGSLLSIASLIDIDDGVGGDSRVDFSLGASPGDLPGGENLTPAFEVTEAFLADSDSPGQSDVQSPYKPGVEPDDQWLGVRFSLKQDRTYTNVVEELGAGGLLRIGLHVTSFPDDGSEAFVTTPEPAMLGLVLLGGLGFLVRRR